MVFDLERRGSNACVTQEIEDSYTVEVADTN